MKGRYLALVGATWRWLTTGHSAVRLLSAAAAVLIAVAAASLVRAGWTGAPGALAAAPGWSAPSASIVTALVGSLVGLGVAGSLLQALFTWRAKGLLSGGADGEVAAGHPSWSVELEGTGSPGEALTAAREALIAEGGRVRPCSGAVVIAEAGRLGRWAMPTSHLGVLAILAGHLIGAIWGWSGRGKLPPGGVVEKVGAERGAAGSASTRGLGVRLVRDRSGGKIWIAGSRSVTVKPLVAGRSVRMGGMRILLAAAGHSVLITRDPGAPLLPLGLFLAILGVLLAGQGPFVRVVVRQTGEDRLRVEASATRGAGQGAALFEAVVRSLTGAGARPTDGESAGASSPDDRDPAPGGGG